MSSLNWGLLGPEKLESSRRTRALGLGASVRNFNELAVPGMGSVWFIRQLILPLMGIRLASLARENGQKVTNLEVANSLEALGCLLAIKLDSESADERVRGRNKFQNISVDELNQLTFSKVRKKNFYVTQPMRMATTSVLPALGLVCEGETRFNNFSLSDKGEKLVAKATKYYRPYNGCLFIYLSKWLSGKGNKKIDNPAVVRALSPILENTQEVRALVTAYLLQGNNQEEVSRRRHALDWVESLRIKTVDIQWNIKPSQITQEHWHDLKSGAVFFETRNLAIMILENIESCMSASTTSLNLDETLYKDITDSIQAAAASAEGFLKLEHTDEDANKFCNELINREPTEVVKLLVARDGNVLRMRGNTVVPGGAFSGQSISVLSEVEDVKHFWPEGISDRIKNLFLFNSDMKDDLLSHLSVSDKEGAQ